MALHGMNYKTDDVYQCTLMTSTILYGSELVHIYLDVRFKVVRVRNNRPKIIFATYNHPNQKYYRKVKVHRFQMKYDTIKERMSESKLLTQDLGIIWYL